MRNLEVLAGVVLLLPPAVPSPGAGAQGGARTGELEEPSDPWKRTRTELADPRAVRHNLDLALRSVRPRSTGVPVRFAEVEPVLASLQAIREFSHAGFEGLVEEVARELPGPSIRLLAFQRLSEGGRQRSFFEELIRGHEQDHDLAAAAALHLGSDPSDEYVQWLLDVFAEATCGPCRRAVDEVQRARRTRVSFEAESDPDARLERLARLLGDIYLEAMSCSPPIGNHCEITWARAEVRRWSERAPEELIRAFRVRIASASSMGRASHDRDRGAGEAALMVRFASDSVRSALEPELGPAVERIARISWMH